MGTEFYQSFGYLISAVLLVFNFNILLDPCLIILIGAYQVFIPINETVFIFTHLQISIPTIKVDNDVDKRPRRDESCC